ncbi:biopolymer transporter ExbB [Aliiroseovarius crassostreae]|uniref:Biopolymer transporter ExbB n=1 Tax=Aliiroseovarius crassostreae TaxID=154981 RepID=A0A9Q9HFI6_9RHOB|nr:biopolymer transporter ExbB [Aliiroseovarius crassostreae]UWP92733.1 biopolymer transporter ExbB [Aliiroseovarius crassostreae]UWP95875.1 biopolymer transporter ExbB [Aliiroseovarius crassostreae]UWP99045.1 biopolymer transporter ExbB [Aliiroseovarius crassostreae]
MKEPDSRPSVTRRKGAEPQFSQPFRQIFVMLVVLGLVGFGGFVALPQVLPVFLANLYLNAFIALVFVVGLLACFWQVWQVAASVIWIEGFVGEREGTNPDRAPRLLAALAKLLSTRGARLQIGASSSRSILDSVATRIDEARDITRYIVNLLIFLGLLGTFFGLATTVPAVVKTIGSLAPSGDEGGVEVFNRLMSGLEEQLGGMGTAFSSSLLGLAGSLVVGLMELFAGHGQNRFYRELEEWLSTITKLSIAPAEGDGDSAAVAYLSAMAEQVEAMQAMFLQTDVNRAKLDARLGDLAGQVHALTEKIDATQHEPAPMPAPDLTPHLAQLTDLNLAMKQMIDGQGRVINALEGQGEVGTHPDAESRMRLRSIDVQMLRLLEEMQAGRQESMAELRQDLGTLIQVIRVAAGQDETEGQV